MLIIFIFDLLCSESECSWGDAWWKTQTFDDLLPLFLVDDLHQASPRHNQVVELVQVKYLFCHNGQPVDWSAAFLHERKQFIQELFPLWVVVNLIELQLNCAAKLKFAKLWPFVPILRIFILKYNNIKSFISH